MSADSTLVVLVGLVIALPVAAIAGLYVYRGLEHRKGMARFRELCRAQELTQGPEMWATVIDGVRVGARCVRYEYLRDGNVNRNYYRWDISYLAEIAPPLTIDLDAFVRTRPDLTEAGGYAAYPSIWQRKDRPPAVPATVHPIMADLHVHATDQADAAALLGEPEVVDAVRDAVAVCNDVRITAAAVELLDDPYAPDAATFDQRLQLAARISRALAARSR